MWLIGEHDWSMSMTWCGWSNRSLVLKQNWVSVSRTITGYRTWAPAASIIDDRLIVSWHIWYLC